MAEPPHTYLCIDLKTFYASVECAERGLDPFTTNLVVADTSRGPHTICLAITPAMKALGIHNRCRMHDIPQGVDYIAAKPHMKRYMEVSAGIYGIYLQYVSPQDVHVYSVDECFIDATPYLRLYGLDAREFADELRGAVLARTGITATAGIGPNLFLAKVALDITAKHAADGIGELDGEGFRRQIWPHRPITDIWGIGPGIAARLARYNVHDLMGVAALDEAILYREFGVNAEYLIDHAHGVEPCTIADIHAYRPAATSISNGQVLPRDYTYGEARTVLHEMVESSVLDLIEQQVVASGISLGVGYAAEGRGPAASERSGADPRGRHRSPGGHAGRQRHLGERTNSRKKLMAAFDELWGECIDPHRAIRRMNIGFGDLLPEEFATCDLFSDVAAEQREHDLQEAIVDVRGRFGKNALVKGVNLHPESTGRERNDQVGGHHA